MPEEEKFVNPGHFTEIVNENSESRRFLSVAQL